MIVSSVLIYPSGAIVSVKVYVPAFKSSIIWSSVVDTQLSTTLPLASFNTKVAPATSSLEVISLLLIATSCVLTGLLYITIWSTAVPLPLYNLPYLSIVKVIVSVLKAYPSGAIVSVKVYVPAANPLITYLLVEEVHFTTSLPSLFLITKVAPGNSLLLVISCLLIVIAVFSFLKEINEMTLPLASFTFPSEPTVNVTVFVLNLYPEGAEISFTV